MLSRTSARPNDFAVLRVAEGGMGYIELVARQEGRFSRLFARKRLHPALRSDPTFRSMFLDEARLAGLLQHPNVTSVIEIGEDGEGPFLLMDYVDGVTVAQLLERVEPLDRLLPVALCVGIVAQAARGLHAAHQLTAPDGTPLAVVHRDISPKNLLLGYDGWLRVTDFGIAKAEGNLEQTLVGVLKGNVGYMSPEVLSFQPVDYRSDLFALGVVLYELLARERLYGGTDANAVARRILHEPPPDLFEVRDLPPELCALTFDLLAKERELRPASALAVATRLEEIGAGLALVEGPFDIAAFLAQELRDVRTEHKTKLEAALSSHVQRSAAPAVASQESRLWRTLALAIALVMLVAVVWGFRRARRELAFAPGAATLWAGGWHTCALHHERLLCWGRNERGQLGDGTRENRNAPIEVGVGPVRAASLQEHVTCTLDGSGSIACWGRNTRGEIGRPTPRLIERPLEVVGVGPASALASGRQHTCALLAGGKVNCWGANDYGQLGRPPSREIGAPGEVPGLPPAVEIFAGGANTCARLANRELVCWGANESGQLRDGTLEDRFTPIPIAGGPDIASLAIGNNGRAGSENPVRSNIVSFMCAASRTGSVSCWGSNFTGQLGDGTREPRTGAVSVAGVSDAIEVAAGDFHACALLRSGAVSCWGRNEFGAVGDASMGPSVVRASAVPALGVEDAVGLALGGAHSCARRRSGAISCWGVNNMGQLGDGSMQLRSVPTAVSGFP